MKKPKVKMSGGKLKSVVVNHIEKLLFVLVFLCFGWMVYSATKVETYTRTPDQLVTVSRDTETHLTNQDFRVLEPQLTDFKPASKVAFTDAKEIDPDQAASNWNDFSRAQKPNERRKKAQVFAPTAMRAHAGIGAIATVADAATQLQKEMANIKESEEAARKQREEAEKAAREQPGASNTPGYGGYGTGRPTGRPAGREGGAAGGYPGGATPGTGRPTGRPAGREGGGYPGAGGYPGMASTGAEMNEDAPEPPVIPTSPDMVLKGARWVCLTGLVPGKKQYEEFKKAAGSDFPLAETPQYMMFEVQRTLYAPGKQPAESDWQEVDVKKALMSMKDWAAQYPEVGKMDNIIPTLAMPLPPLVTRNWGPEVVHAPEIEKLDMQAQTDQMVALAEQIEQLKKEQEEAAKNGSGTTDATATPAADPNAPAADDWSTLLGAQPGGGGYGGGYGGGRGEGGMTGRPPGYGGATGRPPGYGGGATGRPPGYGGAGAGPYGGTGRPGAGYGPMMGYGGGGMSMTPPDHYLLRFFDFTVESGKSYVYRVRLRVRNPNYMMPKTQLEDPQLADAEYVYGEWSAVTDAARVPGNDALVSGESKARDRFNPQVTAYIAHFDPQKGIMLNVEKKLERGQIANTDEKKIEFFDATKNEVADLENVSMRTDLAVVDIFGGENIGKNKAKIAPGRMLLMDAEGNFEVREELTDRTAFASAKAAIEQVKTFKETGAAGAGAAMPGGYPGAAASPYGRGTGRPPGYPGGAGGGEMRGGGR